VPNGYIRGRRRKKKMERSKHLPPGVERGAARKKKVFEGGKIRGPTSIWGKNNDLLPGSVPKCNEEKKGKKIYRSESKNAEAWAWQGQKSPFFRTGVFRKGWTEKTRTGWN